MSGRSMRRAERAVPPQQALDILREAPFATVSCLTPDGLPYGVTVSHAVRGNTLYFHSAMQGLKCDCFAACPAVCVTAVSHAHIDEPAQTTRYRSAVAFGRVRIVTGEEAARGLRVLGERFTPRHMPDIEACIETRLAQTRVYAVDIERISGKSSM